MEEKDRLLQRILSLTTSAPWTENLRLNRESIRTLCEEGMLGRIRRMYLTGGGTSLYAAEVGRSYMERMAGCLPARHFTDRDGPLRGKLCPDGAASGGT